GAGPMNRSVANICVVGFFAGVLILSSIKLHGWATSGHTWPVSSVTYYVNPTNSAGLSAAAVISALQTASGAWTRQSTANFRFVYGGTTTISSAGNDGVNAVMFRPESNGSQSAFTYTWWDAGGNLLNADTVVWENDFSLFTGTSGC